MLLSFLSTAPSLRAQTRPPQSRDAVIFDIDGTILNFFHGQNYSALYFTPEEAENIKKQIAAATPDTLASVRAKAVFEVWAARKGDLADVEKGTRVSDHGQAEPRARFPGMVQVFEGMGSFIFTSQPPGPVPTRQEIEEWFQTHASSMNKQQLAKAFIDHIHGETGDSPSFLLATLLRSVAENGGQDIKAPAFELLVQKLSTADSAREVYINTARGHEPEELLALFVVMKELDLIKFLPELDHLHSTSSEAVNTVLRRANYDFAREKGFDGPRRKAAISRDIATQKAMREGVTGGMTWFIDDLEANIRAFDEMAQREATLKLRSLTVPGQIPTLVPKSEGCKNFDFEVNINLVR